MRQDGPIAKGHERLRDLVGERPESSTETSGQDHRSRHGCARLAPTEPTSQETRPHRKSHGTRAEMPGRGGPALLLALALAGTASCGTHAVGVSDCAAIEKARCIAARGCNDGLDTTSAQAECERFSHDNCLHGLEATEVPRTSDLNACVADIQAAGDCAATSGAKLHATDCVAIGGVLANSRTTVCDVVASPENTSSCSFLLPTASPVDAGAD